MSELLEFGEPRLMEVEGQDSAVLKVNVFIDIPVIMRLDLADEEAEIVNNRERAAILDSIADQLEGSKELAEKLVEAYDKDLQDFREMQLEMQQEARMDAMDRALAMREELNNPIQ